MVAIGHCALVFHAGVGHFNQLVAVLREGIVSEIVRKGLEHPLGLRKLPFRLEPVFRQHVEIEREIAKPVGEVDIIADIE